MKGKKPGILGAACMALSLLLFSAGLAQVFFPELNNWKLVAKGRGNTYTLLLPFGNTDAMMRELHTKSNLYFGTIGGPQVITPSRDISYYAAPNGLIPVYTLQAGHTYAVMNADGYGFVTWPTHSREWRYSRPFVEVDRETYLQTDDIPYEALAALPDCYIRLSDLQALASGEASDWDSNQNRQTYASRVYSPGLFILDEEMDRLDYFYSPNLPRLMFDGWNAGFLTAGILLSAAALLLMRIGKEKRKAAAGAVIKENTAEETQNGGEEG